MATGGQPGPPLGQGSRNNLPETNRKPWSGLFKESCDSKLHFVPPRKDEHSAVLKLPQDILDEGKKQWEKSLMGRFLGTSPDFRTITTAVNKLWGKKGQVRVSKKSSWFIFQFSDEDMMKWVLEAGPWIIGQRYLILQKWSPELTGGTLDLKRIPLWVILRGIPMHLYNSNGISHIASVLGRPLYMDKNTASHTHLDFARVCIEIDVEHELEEVIRVDVGEGIIADIRVVLPWLPSKCSSCMTFGHDCYSQKDAQPPSTSDITRRDSPKEMAQAEMTRSQSVEEQSEDQQIIEENHNVIPATKEAQEDHTEELEPQGLYIDLLFSSDMEKLENQQDDSEALSSDESQEQEERKSEVCLQTCKSAEKGKKKNIIKHTELQKMKRKTKKNRRSKGIVGPSSSK